MVGEVDSAKVVNTFVGGLITEAGPLTFPENASKDELNCLLFRKGNRRRRLGVDYENSGSVSTATVTDASIKEQAIKEGVWTSVGGSGIRNFLVLQLDTTLHFYDLSTDPIADNKKSFTQDISGFAATGASNTGSVPISMTSGRGLLFCSSKKLEPFYIEYDADADSITATQLSLEIRDFNGVDEDVDNDNEPTTLTGDHLYNLKNQGWNSPASDEPDPITTYFAAESLYPANSQQWWVGKDSSEVFDPSLLIKFSLGTSRAPQGHYLLNPFYKDRDLAAGGATGVSVESEDNRPEVLEFFAGRLWYMAVDSSKLNGHIFFSQIVLTPKHAGRCYQQSDPTSEEISQLVATDGGVVVIPEIGKVQGSIVKDRWLIIFASNGVWAISGASNDGFKATDFQVQKITTVGCSNGDAIVETEGFPVWWSDQGIYTLGTDENTGSLTAQSLSLQTIETFYQDDIPTGSKPYARGYYDPASKRIYWLYNDEAPSSDEYRWKFDSALIFDMSIGAFIPWKVAELPNGNSPYLVGAFDLQRLISVDNLEQLFDSSGNTLVDSSGNDVTVTVPVFSGNNTFLKFIAVVPNTADTNNTWAFCEFNNGDFLDWETSNGIGITYKSYAETGYELFETLTKKQIPYVQLFFNKTETGVANGALVNPSSCLLQTKWDWTSSGDAGRWSELQQVYKLKREFENGQVTTHLEGTDIINSEVRVRGHGKAVQFRFESEDGKDFDLAGWQSFIDQQGNV